MLPNPDVMIAGAVIALAFFLGGLVKGVIGVGLPMVAVPLVATVLPPVTAIAVPVVPILLSNIWLLRDSGYFGIAWRRLWPVFVTLVPTVWFAGRWLIGIDNEAATALIGAMLLLFCLLQMVPLQLSVASRREPWIGPIVGFLGGLCGGVSSFFGPVLVSYLLMLRLDKDQFIGAVALCYLVAGTALYATLGALGQLGWRELAISAFALLPLAAGMLIGRRIRRLVSQQSFRKIMVAVLMVVALTLIVRAYQ